MLDRAVERRLGFLFANIAGMLYLAVLAIRKLWKKQKN